MFFLVEESNTTYEITLRKHLKLNVIKPLELTTNLWAMQETKEHV